MPALTRDRGPSLPWAVVVSVVAAMAILSLGVQASFCTGSF